MGVLTIVVLVFSVLGALDYLMGNKFGIGAEFERGFMLLGTMALSMIGMIVIAPGLAAVISPFCDWIYRIFRMDPSVIPASLFANDMGGASLAVEIAKDPQIGKFNALVVSSMLGATISFTIPVALRMVDKQQHRLLALGLLCGIVTIPAGCFLAGLICGIPLGALMVDMLPLVLLAILIGAGLLLAPAVCISVFKVFGFLIKLLVIAGLMIGIVNFFAGEDWIKGMGTLEEGAMICINASVVMAGMFPLIKLVSGLLEKPLKRLGDKLQMNDAGMMGILSSLATSVTTFGTMKDMDSKSVMINGAFAVSGAFTFAGHMAFTMAFDSSYLLPVIAGKTIAGLLAILLAAWIFCRINKDRKGVQ